MLGEVKLPTQDHTMVAQGFELKSAWGQGLGT